jgi:FkbM family methyltransferase
MLGELRWARRSCATRRSLVTYARDVVLLRLLRVWPRLASSRVRRIRLRDGSVLAYRGNRGDIRSIGEVWVQRVYRLPVAAPRGGTLVDLGANIGLATVWLAREYGCHTVVAVEPSPDNARLVRENLEANRIRAEVLEAAVGPHDGTARFARSADSTLGQLDEEGDISVRVVSPDAVLAALPAGAAVDILKLDIEGGEVALMQGDLDWLARVRLIIGELHPDTSDAAAVVSALADREFSMIPAGSVFAHGQTTFYRPRGDVALPTRAVR